MISLIDRMRSGIGGNSVRGRHRRAGALAVCLLGWAVASMQARTADQDRRLARDSSAAGGHRVALVIGNEAYAAAPLKNPINDARAIGDVLRQVGFEVDVVVNVSFRDMARAVDRFIGKLRPGDVALVYFSGHGIQIEGENYLLPVDFDAKDEADAQYVSYSASRLHDRMNAAGAALKILVLDACRNNPYRVSRSVSPGLAQMRATTGSFIGLATGPGSTADDNPSGRNGLFTAAILDALNEPGLNLEQVFYTVRQKVNERSGGRQTPWSNSSVIGDFYFRAPVGAAAPPAASNPVSPQAAPADDLARKAELLFWESIKDSRDPRLFEEYLKRYGDSGLFSVIARAQAQPAQQSPENKIRDLMGQITRATDGVAIFGGRRQEVVNANGCVLTILVSSSRARDVLLRERATPIVAPVAFMPAVSAQGPARAPAPQAVTIQFNFSEATGNPEIQTDSTGTFWSVRIFFGRQMALNAVASSAHVPASYRSDAIGRQAPRPAAPTSALSRDLYARDRSSASDLLGAVVETIGLCRPRR